MTDLIKVIANKEIGLIESSTRNVVTDIFTFKLAQKVLQGLLTEPELDRLRSSLAPVGEVSHFPDKINSLVASIEFWEQLIFLTPKIKSFAVIWNQKMGSPIWFGKHKNKVITMKKIKYDAVAEDAPPTKEDLILTSDNSEVEETKEVDLKKVKAVVRDTDGSVTGIPNGIIEPETILKPEDFADCKKIGADNIPESFKEYKGYYYGKKEKDDKFIAVLKSDGITVDTVGKDLTNIIKVKQFIAKL
jgi:hypothetical protein